jgi:hypothetical protein
MGNHMPLHSVGPRTDRAGQFLIWPMLVLLSVGTAGCATAPLDRAGSLGSYDNLQPSNGLFTRSLLSVSKEDVLAAKTVKIIPTAFSETAPGVFTPAQRDLVTNVVDRTLCAGLSERFEVVDLSQPADLTVRAVVTHVAPTDPVAASLSHVASLAPSFLARGTPIPVPRIPIGLGSLSLEAEARDQREKPKAAMIWGRGASALPGPAGTSARVALEGDAYELAGAFGSDFSTLLVKGKTPFGGLPDFPSIESIGARINDLLGRGPKYPACEAFGRSPGLVGMLGGSLGLPPDWTDGGAARSRH